MSSNGLHEPLQSAYKAGHSTETALTRVQNDILLCMDQQKVTILVMLDLSAAFDTIDHNVLLQRMKERVGVEGVVHDWFESYLSDRSQTVCIDQIMSIAFLLLLGDPQGSVLGPLLFLIYTLPLGDLIRKFGYSLHIFADDMQLYLSVTADKVNGSVPQIERCLSEIHAWMSANFLKLNSNKTEVLTFGTRQQLKKCTLNSINVVGIDVPIQSKPVRNLGVLFDCCMTMSAQVSSVIKTTSFHIRNISRIRKHLTLQAAKKLVNAVVTSRLDYSNALLAGITGGEMKRLQRIQNSAARVIGGVAKFDHISDTRRQLHWLPINQRIDFKIALLTFKCIHGNAPEYLKELLRIQSNVRTNLRSNKSGYYSIFLNPTYRQEVTDHFM